MMMTDRAFATATKCTPKGHLTEAEVWSKVTDLADKANAAAGLTSALDAALRECLVEAVFSCCASLSSVLQFGVSWRRLVSFSGVQA